ncbi:substrate-binding domain-containing protein [Pelagibius litoralis]|uniref:Substrate-binding domain-containing protein n=1 Tax=Pelagibius litoralis TaxID=374515 RepID=A0A967EYK2_9PROT|nr:LacI family DNA-binding transcriptional regulator [Pelagibius litoralis]NIA69801.1 substrate-binding domain-containing protein [Pelagibius litoralis]
MKIRKRLQNPGGRASVTDVAAAARVSTATVSRVLNKAATVKPQTRKAVEEAITALGYIPSGAARSLSSRSSRIIGAIIPSIDNSIFAAGVEALQAHLGARGYHLLIGSSNYDPEEEYQVCRSFLEQHAAGIIMMGETHTRSCLELLERYDTPFVNTGVYAAEHPHHCVGFDNAKVAATAVRHLLQLGHRRFAMIAGITANNDRAIGRLRGVREELARGGLDLPDDRVLERRYDIAESRAAFRALMGQPEPPTAVICGNDVQGFGAILEAQHAGIRIPDQVSVVGFDDLVLSRHLKPSLTTIRVPTQEMWCRAADMLFARLNGTDTPRAVEIETSLILRESTGPAPK